MRTIVITRDMARGNWGWRGVCTPAQRAAADVKAPGVPPAGAQPWRCPGPCERDAPVPPHNPLPQGLSADMLATDLAEYLVRKVGGGEG